MRRAIAELAREAGIVCAAYGPGDGITRYRFIRPDTGSEDFLPWSGNYFGARSQDVLDTVDGAHDAKVWLRGYMAGRNATGELASAAAAFIGATRTQGISDDEYDTAESALSEAITRAQR